MTRSKIAILMSTYNGAQYLKEQIESIQQQTNHDWQLYIRDDGSKDQTVDIAQSYAQQDPRINLVDQGSSNRGVIGSFMRLLKLVDADYYMFADQDDYWHTDKVQRTLDLMQANEETHLPICVHTELQNTDAQLNPLGLLKSGQVWTDFKHFCFGNCVTGCTMMINEPLKQLLNIDSLNLSAIMMHDWWFALVAAAFGKVVYDPTPTIDYRQHGTNVVGGQDTQSLKALVARSLNMDHEIQGLADMLTQMREFQHEYGGMLSGENSAFLNAYTRLDANSSKHEVLSTISKFPPRRTHLRGQLLMSYLLLFRQKKVFN